MKAGDLVKSVNNPDPFPIGMIIKMSKDKKTWRRKALVLWLDGSALWIYMAHLKVVDVNERHYRGRRSSTMA